MMEIEFLAKLEEGNTHNPGGHFRKPPLTTELERFKGSIARVKERIFSEMQGIESWTIGFTM